MLIIMICEEQSRNTDWDAGTISNRNGPIQSTDDDNNVELSPEGLNSRVQL